MITRATEDVDATMLDEESSLKILAQRTAHLGLSQHGGSYETPKPGTFMYIGPFLVHSDGEVSISSLSLLGQAEWEALQLIWQFKEERVRAKSLVMVSRERLERLVALAYHMSDWVKLNCPENDYSLVNAIQIVKELKPGDM